MRAHARWAERYARQRNTHKAIAHFGRALEFGTAGPGYSVAIKVYADKAEVAANKNSYNETGQATKPFLARATDDISDDTSTEFIETLQRKLALQLFASVSSREMPTVRIEIYESSESEVGTSIVEGLLGAERGVYIEMRPSVKEFDSSEKEEIKKAIRVIVPKEMAGVSESDIRPIDALREPKIELFITLEDRAFAEGADSFIWKRSVAGLLRRYIEQCGIYALVRVTKTNTRKRKRPLGGSSASKLGPPIRIEARPVVENDMTDERAELEGKFAICLPGIRRILGRIYEVGSEQEDKIAVSWWLG